MVFQNCTVSAVTDLLRCLLCWEHNMQCNTHLSIQLSGNIASDIQSLFKISRPSMWLHSQVHHQDKLSVASNKPKPLLSTCTSTPLRVLVLNLSHTSLEADMSLMLKPLLHLNRQEVMKNTGDSPPSYFIQPRRVNKLCSLTPRTPLDTT